MTELWSNLCRSAGVELDEQTHQRLDAYIDLLLTANERMNLTRIQNRDDAIVKHVGDALTLLPLIPAGQLRLADIGSGGGIPGIPIAIVRPDLRVTLVESIRKKASFLSQTVTELSLSNAEVVNARVEDLAHSARRESFDIVTARALAGMNVLTEWCLPLVKKGGKLLAMKGEKVKDELPTAAAAIKTLGGGGAVVHAAELPGVNHHVLVEVPKLRSSPGKYPRTPAQVSASPL